ncbi:divergent polysaccharide deacetylase family protein [Campylobacter lari]|nr:divergent polysaccharide deacetylase family protein [Campylobacter lari]EAI8623676.1 divergent polysaccharide deacetylase family protein [Campylobacter lari]EAK0440687.1 divergent polysaccharide deacetylase family protein [Campylobacter lari]EAK9881834.1 divergent polysaccharide deacetylase family protein [Campylobacter lari]EGK8091618.1 divergent polysaccharide deacetylase family protein [Campylobacter lari]MBX1935305.1 divergent polysaccharide deacetylase family protein [Campylobacter lar
MKTINKKYKVLLALCLIVFGIFLFAFGALFLKKEENKTLDYNQTKKELLPPTKEQESNFSFNDINLTLENENLEFLDKNISEILNLNPVNTELNQTKEDNQTLILEVIDQNTSKESKNEEQNISDNSEDNKTQILVQKNTKPRLAIIIDDMASHTHVDMLKKTNLKLIPSFFPPDKRHPYTAEFAKDFDFFMVHLPLAAIKYDKAELNTLHPSDDMEKISKRVAFVKEQFPKVKFINNHTGSLFTANKQAMEKLFNAFKQNDFIFVDSRTIGNSKAKNLVSRFNQPYIARDVFLDNEDDIAYIKNQLKQAVEEARKKGFAIAIGHPREKTFKALVQSKDLLNLVELVYLNEIY